MHTNAFKTAVLTSLGLSIALAAGQALAGTGSERAERFHQKMQERVEAMDTDGDGAISREEALAYAEQRFDRMDLDSDGYITTDEREQIRAEYRERRLQQFP